MKHKKPLISVVMPVYNAGDYLVEAIESILDQTYQHFEFIIVDDGSTDNSLSIIRRYAHKNKKIKVLRNRKNLGVASATNKGLKAAKGEFIARMDADDISLPKRFEKELAYLLGHEEIIAVGGQCLLINEKTQLIGTKFFPKKFSDLYHYSFCFIPFQQGSLMIARNRLPKNFVFYKDHVSTAEEVELIFKIYMYGGIANIPDTVHMYRLHSNNTSLKNMKKTFYNTFMTRMKAIFLYGFRPTIADLIVNLLQLVVISLLGSKDIFAIYQMVRSGNLPFAQKPSLKPAAELY